MIYMLLLLVTKCIFIAEALDSPPPRPPPILKSERYCVAMMMRVKHMVLSGLIAKLIVSGIQ